MQFFRKECFFIGNFIVFRTRTCFGNSQGVYAQLLLMEIFWKTQHGENTCAATFVAE